MSRKSSQNIALVVIPSSLLKTCYTLLKNGLSNEEALWLKSLLGSVACAAISIKVVHIQVKNQNYKTTDFKVEMHSYSLLGVLIKLRVY
jgi:hypothetical protein